MAGATAALLPVEIWYNIAEELDLPDLLNLALSCLRLGTLCSKAVDNYLKKKLRRVELGGRGRREFAAHSFLLRVLRGQFPPSYIEELDCDEDYWNDEDLEDLENMIEHYRKQFPFYEKMPLTPADNDLIRRAVNDSPWIYESEVEDYIYQVRLGNEGAVFCILLPLLTELRLLSLPTDPGRLEIIAARIAAAATVGPRTTALPLSRLLLVMARAENGNYYGISLESMAPFAALLSVRRLIVMAGRNEGFEGWPVGLPLSRASEVFFVDSTITKSAVRGFAAGFAGPCIIRQWFSDCGSRFRPDEGHT